MQPSLQAVDNILQRSPQTERKVFSALLSKFREHALTLEPDDKRARELLLGVPGLLYLHFWERGAIAAARAAPP